LVFVSLFLLSVVFARFRAFSRVVIPNEFQPDSARIGLEQVKTTNPQERAKTHECFFFRVDPRPSVSSALIRVSSYVFQASLGRVKWEQFGTRMHADLRGWPRIKRMS
jgi:hypothetical protein